ncbi:hypothetical protein B0H14DRAFT_2603242 [Mycena olivaceomarginata]|nr:hypothetical protein B0H14DRAFT_2603242 [Mycena olivaceomarginata]
MYGDKPVDAVDLFRFGTHLWVVLQITVLPEALLHFTDVDDADHAIQSGRGYYILVSLCEIKKELCSVEQILQKLLAGANRQVKTSYFSHPWENLSNLRHACRKGQVKFNRHRADRRDIKTHNLMLETRDSKEERRDPRRVTKDQLEVLGRKAEVVSRDGDPTLSAIAWGKDPKNHVSQRQCPIPSRTGDLHVMWQLTGAVPPLSGFVLVTFGHQIPEFRTREFSGEEG